MQQMSKETYAPTPVRPNSLNNGEREVKSIVHQSSRHERTWTQSCIKCVALFVCNQQCIARRVALVC